MLNSIKTRTVFCHTFSRTALFLGIAFVCQFQLSVVVQAQDLLGKQLSQKNVLADPNAKIMAVVNRESISRQQLALACQERYGDLVWQNLINKQLILDACTEYNITITNQQVEEELVRMAAKLSLTAKNFLDLLEKERDISPQQVRRDIVWPSLALRMLATKQVQVSPQDLQKSFEANYGPRVVVRMILAKTKTKADEVYQLVLQNPDDFGTLAKQHSEDITSASSMGIIPAIRKHSDNPEIEAALFSLKEGEISPILLSHGQYFIFKCEQHIPAQVISKEDRATIEKQLIEKQAESQLANVANNILKSMQKKATVLKVYDDPELQKKYPGVAAVINNRKLTLRQFYDECLIRKGKEILQGEINRKILTQALAQAGQTVSQADIQEEIARAAKAEGYIKSDYSPDVDRWIEAVTQKADATLELYIQDSVWPSVALKKLVHDKIEVSSADLQKGFEANYGPRVELQAIVLGNRHDAQNTWNLARSSNNEKFFGQLAAQYSIEPVSKANNGHIIPVSKHSGRPLVEKEAFKLQAGELSPIIETEGTFIILRCLGRTEPVVKDFNAVREELHNDIFEKKLRVAMSQMFELLRTSAQIDNFVTGESQPGRATITALRNEDADKKKSVADRLLIRK